MPIVRYTQASPEVLRAQQERDTLGSFFYSGISKHPLLKADEKLALLKQVEIIRLVQETQLSFAKKSIEPTNEQIAAHIASHYPRWSHLTERSLPMHMRQAHAAKTRLIECNLRWVVTIAKKYRDCGLELEVRIQEGTIGLSRGIEKFDLSKNYQLSTYIYYWIRQGIQRAIQNDTRTIRVPIHVSETRNRIKKCIREFYAAHRRKPTEAEIIELTGLTAEKIKIVAEAFVDIKSLDLKLCQGETELSEIIAAKGCASPMDSVSQTLLTESVQKALDCLPPRERQVIELRFGLLDGTRRTLDQVGQIMELSRERIRQIQTKATRRLRGSKLLRTIAEEVDCCA